MGEDGLLQVTENKVKIVNFYFRNTNLYLGILENSHSLPPQELLRLVTLNYQGIFLGINSATIQTKKIKRFCGVPRDLRSQPTYPRHINSTTP